MSKKKDGNLQDKGLEVVLERSLFYHECYKSVYFCMLSLLLAGVMLTFSIVYKYTHPVPPKYFVATADGSILSEPPLTQPELSDNEIIQWSKNSVQRLFSLDYVHWRQQLQDASSLFFKGGPWDDFLQKLKATNNLKTLTVEKMVSMVQITSFPKIIAKGVAGGRYWWKVELNLNIVFESDTKTIQMPFQVELAIGRVHLREYPSGVALFYFSPTAIKST